MSTSPGKWSLRQCLQHWSLTLEERVGHCVADVWASSSCERTVPSQVCACSIDLYDNNIPLLHMDGETTMWITTASEQDCCQLNQRYQHTIKMDPPHNCNEQLPTVYQPRTDVTGLPDMWGTKTIKGSMQKNRLWITRGDGELALARTHPTWLMTVAMLYGPL